jgi:hypothetical protein
MPTLKEVMPDEFERFHYEERSFRYADIEVVTVHGYGYDQCAPWPGPQQNVHLWVELANGHAVGWNENPSRGWSFPSMKLKGK